MQLLIESGQMATYKANKKAAAGRFRWKLEKTDAILSSKRGKSSLEATEVKTKNHHATDESFFLN